MLIDSNRHLHNIVLEKEHDLLLVNNNSHGRLKTMNMYLFRIKHVHLSIPKQIL